MICSNNNNNTSCCSIIVAVSLSVRTLTKKMMATTAAREKRMLMQEIDRARLDYKHTCGSWTRNFPKSSCMYKHKCVLFYVLNSPFLLPSSLSVRWVFYPPTGGRNSGRVAVAEKSKLYCPFPRSNLASLSLSLSSRCCEKKSCGNRNETPSDPVVIDR